MKNVTVNPSTPPAPFDTHLAVYRRIQDLGLAEEPRVRLKILIDADPTLSCQSAIFDILEYEFDMDLLRLKCFAELEAVTPPEIDSSLLDELRAAPQYLKQAGFNKIIPYLRKITETHWVRVRALKQAKTYGS